VTHPNLLQYPAIRDLVHNRKTRSGAPNYNHAKPKGKEKARDRGEGGVYMLPMWNVGQHPSRRYTSLHDPQVKKRKWLMQSRKSWRTPSQPAFTGAHAQIAVQPVTEENVGEAGERKNKKKKVAGMSTLGEGKNAQREEIRSPR